MSADHVADVLAEIFRRGGMKRAVRRAEAVLLWPQAVGPELARFSAAKTLRDGTLIVEVSDSETAMHLSLQRERFLRSYRDRLGVKELREIRFVVGRPPAPREPEEVTAPEVDPDPSAVAELSRSLADMDLPDDLAATALETGKALLTQRARHAARGWKPCPVCETLTPQGELCDTCERYRSEPRVLAAAARLVMDPAAPTHDLGDDERVIARSLARDSIDEMLLELLPQVLAEPELRDQLEQVAIRSLALELDKAPSEITEDDFHQLDPRVVRALGRWRGHAHRTEEDFR